MLSATSWRSGAPEDSRSEGEEKDLRPANKVDLIAVNTYTKSVWDVEYTDEFGEWWLSLSIEQQEALDDRVMLLAEHGPGLKRPVVAEILSSRHSRMKELRISRAGSLRVLFAFDPRRHAILLLGGDKTGQWAKWYRTAIPIADALYDAHLDELRIEGLLDGSLEQKDM